MHIAFASCAQTFARRSFLYSQNNRVLLHVRQRPKYNGRFPRDCVRAKYASTSAAISASPAHVPVLVDEVVSHFSGSSGRPLRRVLDCTVGAGGHAEAILSSSLFKDSIIQYVAIDKDVDALEICRNRLVNFGPKVSLIHGDFRYLSQLLTLHGIDDTRFDAALLDLGVSSMQLDEGARGFSFARDGPLDMRMDTSTASVRAEDLVNGLDSTQLAQLFWEFADDSKARVHAKRIVNARERYGRIVSTAQLARIVCGGNGERVQQQGRLHPATKVFQALRIAVNEELGAIDLGLNEVMSTLEEHGLVAVVSFHSGEDRIVKSKMKEWEDRDVAKIVTRKPVTPSADETRQNRRARSAKLRVAQKLKAGETAKRRKVNKYRMEVTNENEKGKETCAEEKELRKR